MGLAAFGDPSAHSNLNILSINENGIVNIDFPELYNTFKTPNLFCKDFHDFLNEVFVFYTFFS